MMKIVSVLGARPQFIKFAPVDAALKTAGVQSLLIHTGQHYDANMSDVFFNELSIAPPHHHLGIGSSTHGRQTGQIMTALEPVLGRERPDWVLVFGDTNSTLASALVAAKLGLPVAHIEAGLRSYNRNMPEEINRVVADHLSTLLFAPTEAAVRNLAAEGIVGEKVRLVGDVMFDAALMFAAHAAKRSSLLSAYGLNEKQYALATVHRAENTDDQTRLEKILAALTEVTSTVKVVLPLHPRTRKLMPPAAAQAFAAAGGMLIEPVGYLDMVNLERCAAIVVTDSGGVQKEAFFHRVPCVTLREETEWVELIEAGWNQLVPPTDPGTIARSVLAAIGRQGSDASFYGDGRAAIHIVGQLRSFNR